MNDENNTSEALELIADILSLQARHLDEVKEQTLNELEDLIV